MFISNSLLFNTVKCLSIWLFFFGDLRSTDLQHLQFHASLSFSNFGVKEQLIDPGFHNKQTSVYLLVLISSQYSYMFHPLKIGNLCHDILLLPDLNTRPLKIKVDMQSIDPVGKVSFKFRSWHEIRKLLLERISPHSAYFGWQMSLAGHSRPVCW